MERPRDTAVFDRDGWRCQLCGGDIDAENKWPRPFSASLDYRHSLTEFRKGGGRPPAPALSVGGDSRPRSLRDGKSVRRP